MNDEKNKMIIDEFGIPSIDGIRFPMITKEQGCYITYSDSDLPEPWMKTTTKIEPKSFTQQPHSWVYLIVEWRSDLYPNWKKKIKGGKE